MKTIYKESDVVTIDHFAITRHEQEIFNETLHMQGGMKYYTFARGDDQWLIYLSQGDIGNAFHDGKPSAVNSDHT